MFDYSKTVVNLRQPTTKPDWSFTKMSILCRYENIMRLSGQLLVRVLVLLSYNRKWRGNKCNGCNSDPKIDNLLVQE